MRWSCLLFVLSVACSAGVPRGTSEKAVDSAGPEGDEIDDTDGQDHDSGPTDSGGSPPSCVDWQPPEPAPTTGDCDGDGTSDAEALAAETALDCDENGLPDHCQALSGCTTAHPEGWLEYRAGTLPIVLSAPHGGTLRPSSLDDRPDASTGGDTNTQELTLAVADALEARTGQRPHVVLMHLHRHKVEANVWTLAEGTAGQPEAEAAWLQYHRLIDHARQAVEWRYGRGLYVDLHGMAASRDTLELGYLLSGTGLAVDDDRLAHPAYAANSALRAAEARARQTGSGDSFAELLRGPDSLGGRLQSWGYEAVPSPANPWPVDEDGEPRGYFDGGYSTGAHGARLGGTVDGVQIEHTWAGVRDTAENRATYAAALADSLERWLGRFQDLPLDTTATVGFVEAGPARLWETGVPRELWLERRGLVEGALELPVVVGGDADAVGVSEVVRFEAGDRFAAVELAAVADGVETGPRTVRVGLGAVDGVLPGAVWERTVVVADAERSSAWLAMDEDTVVEGAAGTVRLERDDCPADAAPVLSAEGLEAAGLALVHPSEGAVGDGDALPVAAGEAAVALVLDSTADGVEEPLKDVTLGIEGDTALALRRVDGDLDPALAGWWLAGEGWTRDHTGGGAAARLLPSAEEGPQPGERGLVFDGVDDVVVVDQPPLPAGPAPLTVALWFRADAADAGGYAYLLSHSAYYAAGALNVYLTPAGTLRTVPTGLAEDYDVDLLDVSSGLYDDAWHHLALVVDEVDGVWTARVYLDGALGAEAARGAGGISTAGMGLFLGGRHDTWPTTHFAGELAGLRVVHRAWSAAEVAAAASL
jgi:hypothetical protein